MNLMSNDYIRKIVDAPINQTVKLNNNTNKIKLEENRSDTGETITEPNERSRNNASNESYVSNHVLEKVFNSTHNNN